ncbi:MAG: YdcH family protein [Alphaproteobacteria bacterium]|nr:YdcH family protein [Alphaproteobacteria bacterium]
MSEQSHLDALKHKHNELENLIKKENLRPQPDQNIMNQLKRMKLRIKEEISVFNG